MSLTVLALITEALEEIGASAAGEALVTADSTKALAVLNRFVDSSNILRGQVATLRRDLWTLTPGTQAYTIGIDPAAIPVVAAFVAARPIRIERANVLLTSSGDTIHRPLNLLTTPQWAEKGDLSVRSIPTDLYNDGAYPLSTYYFDPIPDAAYQIETWTWQQFAQFATSADVLAIPPSYYEYLLYGTAIRLAAPFGRTPSPATLELFNEARAAIQALNAPSPRIRSDGDLGGDGGTFNWRTGLTLDT